jgi:hypothetical protein
VGESYSCASGGVIAAGRSVKTALQIAAEALVPGNATIVSNATLNTAGTNGTIPWGATGSSGSLTMLDWANDMPWDSVKKRVYASGGRGYSDPLAQKMVKFDAKENAWESFINPWQGGTGGHMYDAFDYASNHQKMLHIPFGNAEIHVWDTITETVGTPIPSPPTGSYGGLNGVSTLTWHPTLGAEGSIVFMNLTRKRIQRYDWQSAAWSELKLDAVAAETAHLVSVYLPGPEIVLIGAALAAAPPYQALNIIDNTGAWSTTSPLPCQVSCNGAAARGPIVPHPDGNGAIIFSLDDGHIYHWIAATDTWHDRGMAPANLIQVTSVACSIPEYGVVLFIDRGYGGAVYSCNIYKPGF